jgi:hypothetical protein
MIKAELHQVIYAVDAYQKCKDTFSQFSDICKKILSNDNDFKVEFVSSDDITISIMVFDQPVEISLSIVIRENEPAIGKLIFERVLRDDKRNNLWALYFDELGNTRNSLEGHSNMYNLTQENCLEPILIQVLDSYIKIYFANN